MAHDGFVKSSPLVVSDVGKAMDFGSTGGVYCRWLVFQVILRPGINFY
jgi:hypothetical protein